jgi:hypothetical protein
MSQTAVKPPFSPQQKWSISDIQVKFDSHWWGFEIHLNEAATS